MNRRQLLIAAPAALVVPPVHAGDSQTPILRLLRQYEALLDESNSAPFTELTDEEYDERYLHPLERIQEQMLALPSTCAADFAAKLCSWTYFGAANLNSSQCPELWAEARQLLGMQHETA